MAYVSVPKDLNIIKSKIVFKMTKRQLICFGTAVIIGIPIYLFTRGAIGNTPAVFLMMIVMSPLFFLGMYEKDGQPAERIVRNYIRAKFYWPRVRPYKTVNFYNTITKEQTAKEGINFAKTNTKTATSHNKKATTATKQKHSAREVKQRSTPKRQQRKY